MTIIIGISGKIGAGKNYLAERLIEVLDTNGFTVDSASFAFPLKDQLNSIARDVRLGMDARAIARIWRMPLPQAETLYGYVRQALDANPELDAHTDRSLGTRSALQYLGSEVRRAADQDYWVRLFHETLDSDADFTFVTDARFPNEVDSILGVNGVAVRLEVPAEIILDRTRNRDGLSYTAEQLNHQSETALDDYQRFDVIVGHEFDADALTDQIVALGQNRTGN